MTNPFWESTPPQSTCVKMYNRTNTMLCHRMAHWKMVKVVKVMSRILNYSKRLQTSSLISIWVACWKAQHLGERKESHELAQLLPTVDPRSFKITYVASVLFPRESSGPQILQLSGREWSVSVFSASDTLETERHTEGPSKTDANPEGEPPLVRGHINYTVQENK